MLGTWIALLMSTAHAATLEMALKDRVGMLHAPGRMEVSIGFRGGPESAPVEATWTNTESNSVAIVCSDKGAPPMDDNVEQVMLQVGEDKWALAPGSAVHFTCAAGSKVIVTDLHGTTVGTFPGQVTMTVNKAKSRTER